MAPARRLRTYLTRDEVAQLLRIVRKSRHGARDHAMILIAYRQDVVLAGSVAVRLVVSIDSRDTDSAVRLFDAAPDGSKTLVATGWLGGSHRNSDEAPSPVIPNVRTVFPVEIWPSHWRFFAGHQVEIW